MWVWEPFLPEGGLVVLAASPKVGKSTVAAALAVAVAQGRPFLGYPVKQRAVLLLALEEHRRDVRRRFERFGLRPDDPLWVQCDSFRLSPERLRELEEFVRTHGIGLIIIDTLGRLWTVQDENDNAEIERALGPLLDLARRTSACVLLIHHERKGAAEQAPTGETIRGGSALLGLVDQALLLRPGAAANERVLATVGRYSETPRRLRLRLVGDGFERVEGEPPSRGRPDRDAQVCAALSEAPQTVEELAQRTGLSERQVRAALEQLGPAVVREGAGVRGAPHTYRRAVGAAEPGERPSALPRAQGAAQGSAQGDGLRPGSPEGQP